MINNITLLAERYEKMLFVSDTFESRFYQLLQTAGIYNTERRAIPATVGNMLSQPPAIAVL